MASLSAFSVVIICFLFAVTVMNKYVQSRRASHFFWGVSLVFSCLASLSYCVCVWSTPHNAEAFLLYYILGALWMPALMGLGSCALLMSQRVLLALTTAVAITGLAGALLLFGAHVSLDALTSLNGGAGVGVIQQGLWLVPLIVLNMFGGIAVVVVALISAIRSVQRKSPRRFFYGNVWLAAGVLIISSAGAAARLGWPQVFWLTMLCGWIVSYIGYRMLTPNVVSKMAIQMAQ